MACLIAIAVAVIVGAFFGPTIKAWFGVEEATFFAWVKTKLGW